MKRGSLIVAVLVIPIANAFALIHAVRNRAGRPEAEVTLTQRELQYLNRAPSDDDSGVDLTLKWTDPDHFPFPPQVENSGNPLDQQKLESLGFDCGVKPDSTDAGRFYERQRARKAYVALEYDGAAWQAWFAAYTRVIGEQQAGNRFYNLTESGLNSSSHLITIDADLDASKLRARHPDRASVIILPAVVAITIVNFPYPGARRAPQRPARLRGDIRELSASIHVPRPFSDAFRRLNEPRSAIPGRYYRVHLRYGASLEPWVAGVEFMNPN